MLPDWVSNPGPLTYESGALLIALRGPLISPTKWMSPFLVASAVFEENVEVLS